MKHLSEVSYYKTGGTCDEFYEPHSIKELSSIIKKLHISKIPYFLLGSGSNSLIMDDHWQGAVISLQKLTQVRLLSNHQLYAEAGVENTEVALECHKESLSGASFLYYLPGRFGSTVRMNARCYDGEASQIISSVTALTLEGKLKIYQNDEIFLGYKNTIFQKNGQIIVSAILQLAPGKSEEIKSLMNKYKKDREDKQQFLYPSCGCVFKNNYNAGISAGKLLDEVGAKRLKTPNAMVSPFHANFVFNLGNASSEEILEITFMMRDAVYNEFGVWLEYEMEILGTLPNKLAARMTEKKPQNFNESKLERLRTKFTTEKSPLKCN